jgi:hypothetical protein
MNNEEKIAISFGFNLRFNIQLTNNKLLKMMKYFNSKLEDGFQLCSLKCACNKVGLDYIIPLY